MLFSKVLSLLVIAQAALGFDFEKRLELPQHLELLKREAADADPASYQCHSDCGYAILAVYNCSSNGDETAPFNENCLCGSDSTFNSLMPACLNCGWCLYTDYWPYLETAIASCSTIPITPTGSQCSPTTSISIIALDLNASGLASNSTITGLTSRNSTSLRSSSVPTSSFLSSSLISSDSDSSSADASSSAPASTSVSTGMGTSLKISGVVGFAGLAFLMI